MKNLIVNIFKTLFFFDLAVIVIPILPEVNKKNPALDKFYAEAIVAGFMLLLTLVFFFLIEKRKLTVPIKKKPIRSFLWGLLSGLAVPGVIVALLATLKHLKFTGFKDNITDYHYWILAILFNAIASELLFRGYLLNLYRKYYGFTRSAIISTALYLSLNFKLLEEDGILIANIILLNILLCFLFEFSNSIITTVTAHFTYILASTFLLGSYPLTGGYPSVLGRTFAKKEFYVGAKYPLESSKLMLAVLCAVLLIFMIIKYRPITQLKKLINFIKSIPDKWLDFKYRMKMRRKGLRVKR